MSKLDSITIRGYRSFKDATLELRSLNVLIGANGAGKSNLVSFFKMLNEIAAGRLQRYLALTGRATSNLHFGPTVSPHLEAELKFETDSGDKSVYRMRLGCAAGDTLKFNEECLSFHQPGIPNPVEAQLGSGHRESLVMAAADGLAPTAKTAKALQHLLNNCRVFHFHDTSPSSRVRNSGYVGDSHLLLPDAGNLAAVLFRLKSERPDIYRRIVDTIRQIVPLFDGFELRPEGSEGKNIILKWRHCDSGTVLGPHQLSDGTLRTICLVSLLMLPPKQLPLLTVIDGPELGLHPYALNIVGSLCRSASTNSQILISTQSSAFVNCFEPSNLVVVERNGLSSVLGRLDENILNEWLNEYALGEIWEKNIIGGGPH